MRLIRFSNQAFPQLECGFPFLHRPSVWSIKNHLGMMVDVKILLVNADLILHLGLRQTIAQQHHLSVVGEVSTGDGKYTVKNVKSRPVCML